ncbi:hypothetical protein DINM_005755 [Dirofilaria immitis]|nr:hypothetical protein [Dirofilaria immitis]
MINDSRITDSQQTYLMSNDKLYYRQYNRQLTHTDQMIHNVRNHIIYVAGKDSSVNDDKMNSSVNDDKMNSSVNDGKMNSSVNDGKMNSSVNDDKMNSSVNDGKMNPSESEILSKTNLTMT